MTKRFSLLSLWAVCLVAAASFTILFAQDAAPGNWPAAEKGYTQANLALAEARLALALSQQDSVADSVSEEGLNSLRADVENARAQLQQQLGAASRPASMSFAIAAAEQDLKACQGSYTKSIEANKLAAGSVPDLELRKEQAELNVAKARLAAVRLLQNQSPEVRMQWQINQLQDQIRALWARPLIED